MSPFTRRRFLGQASLVSLSSFPSLFCRTGWGAGAARAQRSLVVIQLSGGNDGINTIIPYADESYAKYRTKLRIRDDKMIRLNDEVGLHPSLRAMADLQEDGHLAMIQGVGYPNPNRSHEESMAIWHSARLDPLERNSYGWLGRTMDQVEQAADGAPHMILCGDENLPVALRGRRSISVAMAHSEDLQIDPRAKIHLASQASSRSDLVAFASDVAQQAYTTSALVAQKMAEQATSNAKYPATSLATRLKSIAQWIKTGLSTPVYYAIQAGYDTHSTQLPVHARLLKELADAIKAFRDDLLDAGLLDRVTTLCFSEFGRRVEENASLGTDHGTAGPVFVMGNQIQPGLIGSTPRLSDLIEGDLKMSIDFRQVYHRIITDWFESSSQPLFDEPINPIPLFSRLS